MLSSMLAAAMVAAGIAVVALAASDGPAGEAKAELTFPQYVRQLSEQALARRNGRIAKLRTKADALRWAAELKQWYRRRVGPVVPLEGPQRRELCGKVPRDGYRVEKWLFETMPGTFSTSHLYVPARPNAAGVAVVAPIGHWKQGKFAKSYQRLGAYMAHNGVAVLVYDHPGVGERREWYDPVRDEPRAGNSPTDEHDRTGLPVALAGIQPARFYLTEAVRARQFLAGFDFVKPERIGFTGASGGGSITRELACYTDELAFAICVVIIRGPHIGGLGDSEQACWGDGARGVTAGDQLTAAVPRPVMIITERPDDGSKETYATLRKIYDLAGAPKSASDYYAEDTSHAYHCSFIERAYAFLARQFGLDRPDPATWRKVKALTPAESNITRGGYLYRDRPQVTMLQRIALMCPKPKGIARADLPAILAVKDWTRSPLGYRVRGTVGRKVRVTGARRMGEGDLGLLDLDPPPEETAPEAAILDPAVKPPPRAKPPAPAGPPPRNLGHNKLGDEPDCDAQRELTHHDRSLVGLRVRQILDFARDHPEVEELSAEGPRWAVPLTFAAPLLPDSVRRVTVKYVPASFRAIMSAEVNTTNPGLYVQGLLIHGDMDDVIRLAGKRLTVHCRINADGVVVAP